MPWIQVSVAANTDNYQRVEDTLISLGAQSITYKDAADNPILEPQPGETPLWRDAVLTGLFDNSVDPEAISELIRQRLDDSTLNICTESLPDQDWTRTWMEAFKPMRFGQKLWVCPKHIEPPDPQAVNLRLDPGLAFGTGTHPTTSLCLQWLDAHVSRHSGHHSVLDFGCGSGILGIAALLLGADHADCVDIDEQALQSSQENALGNGVSGQIRTCLPQDLDPAERYDLVLANILSGPLTELAPTLAQHCSPGGDIVLSGILQEQARPVADAYTGMFEMSPAITLDDWVLLHGKRNG